jgi:hypothetical protein
MAEHIAISFKKRGAKKNLHSRKPEVGVKLEEGGEVDEGLDTRTLEEIRFEQELRRRKHGVSASKVSGEKKKSTAVDASSASSGLGNKEYTSVMVSGVVPDKLTKHEDIMEEYVNKRLGNDSNEKDEQVVDATAAADAELYKLSTVLDTAVIPATATNDINERDSNADVGIYTGIAEVELPASYALQNIKDTEKTKRLLYSNSTGNRYKEGHYASAPKEGCLPSTLGYRRANGGYDGKSDRFTKPMSRAEYAEREAKRTSAEMHREGRISIPTVPLPPGDGVDVEAASHSREGKRSHDSTNNKPQNTASDNRLMESYRKKMRR